MYIIKVLAPMQPPQPVQLYCQYIPDEGPAPRINVWIRVLKYSVLYRVEPSTMVLLLYSVSLMLGEKNDAKCFLL